MGAAHDTALTGTLPASIRDLDIFPQQRIQNGFIGVTGNSMRTNS